ncbi:uncharacterized protein LTR77_002892 [Saxophila tyrrhenica]|uniref:Uncharacterized protein n=1 Tax=Saxophila tyrrhenica TaxID=1690608 RepID=A0AAV9PJ04_9PEZI|nr:hypothetical protein LTR77_002892 [Saxophila tyrrhenica]
MDPRLTRRRSRRHNLDSPVPTASGEQADARHAATGHGTESEHTSAQDTTPRHEAEVESNKARDTSTGHKPESESTNTRSSAVDRDAGSDQRRSSSVQLEQLGTSFSDLIRQVEEQAAPFLIQSIRALVSNSRRTHEFSQLYEKMIVGADQPKLELQFKLVQAVQEVKKLKEQAAVKRAESEEVRVRLEEKIREHEEAKKEIQRMQKARSTMIVYSIRKLGCKPRSSAMAVEMPAPLDPDPKLYTVKQPAGVRLNDRAWLPPTPTLPLDDDIRCEDRVTPFVPGVDPAQEVLGSEITPPDTPTTRTTTQGYFPANSATAMGASTKRTPAQPHSDDEDDYAPPEPAVPNDKPSHDPKSPPKHPRCWDEVERPQKQQKGTKGSKIDCYRTVHP